jgi:hypothetical protein
MCPSWPGSCCVAQAVLELMILLLPPPMYWDYRNAPACLDKRGFLK